LAAGRAGWTAPVSVEAQDIGLTGDEAGRRAQIAISRRRAQTFSAPETRSLASFDSVGLALELTDADALALGLDRLEDHPDRLLLELRRVPLLRGAGRFSAVIWP